MKKKYSFLDKEVAIAKIEELYNKYKGEDAEDFALKSPMTIGGHTIVYLGQLPKEDAVYNEEGNTITEAVLYDDYAVDVLWRIKKDVVEYDEEGNEELRIEAIQDFTSWEDFKIETENPKHSFC